jgi:hypothetical protein
LVAAGSKIVGGKRRVKKAALLVLLIASLTIGAFAQRPEEKRGEVYGGFTHLTGDIGKSGWNVSGAFNFSRWVSAEADLAGYYGSEDAFGLKATDHVHTYMFGPKIAFNTQDERFTPWAHFLIGGGHESGEVIGTKLSDNALTWALGGGVDWHFHESWAARGKLDLLRTDFFNNGDTHARWGFGLVYNF